MAHQIEPDTLATIPQKVRDYIASLEVTARQIEAASRQTPASPPFSALRLKDVTQRISSFTGNRKQLKSFLFDVDHAIRTFPTSFLNDIIKIEYTANLFSGTAKLWWQTNYNTAIQDGTYETTTYDAFKGSLKGHFGDQLEEKSIMN